MDKICYAPIGVIRSPYQEPVGMPTFDVRETTDIGWFHQKVDYVFQVQADRRYS